MAIRQNVRALNDQQLSQLRSLLDQFINKPTDNPVEEHRLAGMDMSLMIHEMGFVAWHQHFVAKLENWLVVNNADQYVPLPVWDPADDVPSQLNKNNNNVNVPLPPDLSPQALEGITSYADLNGRLVPYHNAVHDALGGQMPHPETSPSDPIFWPFHSFLVGVYESWRNM